MKTYKVWLVGESALALEEPIGFEFGDATIEVANHIIKSHPSSELVYDGLEYHVLINANDIKDAMIRARSSCVIVSDWLSIVHSTAITDPVPIFAFDYDETTTDRQFAQVERNLPLSIAPRRVFKKDPFRLFHSSWNDLKDKTTTDRLRRAMTLLRLSYTELDTIDQFEDVWDGLETINPLIRKKYSLPETYPGSKCSNCGNQVQVPGSSSGIRHATTKLLGLPPEDWNSLREVRNDIAHGIKSFADILPRLEMILPIARHALLNAILDLMEIPQDQRSQFLRTPFQAVSGINTLAIATLHNLPIEDLDKMTIFPRFKIHVEEIAKEGQIGIAGTKSVTFRIDLQVENFSGTFSNANIEVAVEKDPEDQAATLTRIDQKIVHKKNDA